MNVVTLKLIKIVFTNEMLGGLSVPVCYFTRDYDRQYNCEYSIKSENVWYTAPMGYGFGTIAICIQMMRMRKTD